MAANKELHENYIRRYLPLTDSLSDRRLLERILYWFCGRPSLTASLIELLLFLPNPPHHRVLSAFAHHLTGFTITDAMDLEDAEDPIPCELQNRIQEYGRLSSAERIFTGEDQDPRLAQIVVDAFRKWVIENGATRVPAETGNHHLICCGVGCIREERVSSPDKIYPVFIDEPLAIIFLGSILKRQLWTQRKALLQNSFAMARNPSSLGFISEEMALLVVMVNFGGKFVALGHIFHGDDPHLLQRKVSLVALKQISDGIMQCCPVSWNAGASDRLGVKASSPAHVLEFLRNPDGIPFLFPGIHMGPDLIAYLQDQETKELMALTLQAKFDHRLDKGSWINAVDSTTPSTL